MGRGGPISPVTCESAGVNTELWFENARSLGVKLDLAREMRFRQ